jgi:hypothetical protein
MATNMGLPLGPQSGLVSVDIDTDDSRSLRYSGSAAEITMAACRQKRDGADLPLDRQRHGPDP